MKVSISVGGKFHAFHLARQLEKRGYLDAIFTSRPWFAVRDSGLSSHKVRCLFAKEVLERLLYKAPYLNHRIDIPHLMLDFFDKQVSRRIRPCDIFIGSSGYSLNTIKEIRKHFPAKVIIDKVSSHIQFYRDTLAEEQERLGVKISLPPSFLVEKELQEYGQADYIAVPSIFAKETFLQKNFPENKLVCVSWGVDPEIFHPLPKKDKIFRIIGVGMRFVKGIHYLLQAVSDLNIKGIEVWLIGGGMDEGLLPFLRKFPVSFKYLGAVAQPKLYEYYSQGSVFVLPSLEDGFGMALLEAMSCGLPVICSDRVGAKDAVRDNTDGFIVPARNVEALKKKLRYLYENPDIAREMGKEARRNIVNNYTWDHYGEKIASAYLGLLKY